MNKGALVEAIAEKLETTKAQADRVLDALLEEIKKGVKKDGQVQLIGFGTFKISKRKARMGRNPQTGEAVKIKASKSVSFKPGQAFKTSL